MISRGDTYVGRLCCVLTHRHGFISLWDDWCSRTGREDYVDMIDPNGIICIVLHEKCDSLGYRGGFIMTISGLYGWIYVDYLKAL